LLSLEIESASGWILNDRFRSILPVFALQRARSSRIDPPRSCNRFLI
jgi:hypothetical protein